ncbi:MAG: nucleoside deaminase [Clostridia bacterium]|nr:nucleoside deaminase [Clostridia bacterium]
MEEALAEALRALPDDVPVGAVVVREGAVVGRGCNTRQREGDICGHAELNALRDAARRLGGWNLTGCTLYVTLEPCPMCAGAIAQARIDRVVFGAADPKAGAMGSVCDLTAMPFPHAPRVTSGVLEEACAALLTRFFAALREERGSFA